MNAKRLAEICDELDRVFRDGTPDEWEILGRDDTPILDCALTWGELRGMAIELRELRRE